MQSYTIKKSKLDLSIRDIAHGPNAFDGQTLTNTHSQSNLALRIKIKGT